MSDKEITIPIIKMPEPPSGKYLAEILESHGTMGIWEIGFKEGLIAYELAMQGHTDVKRI